MSKLLLPIGTRFGSLVELKAICRGSYKNALYNAKRDIGAGCYRSRGKYIKAYRDGNLVVGESDGWEWDGTLKMLVSAIDDCRFGALADTVVIEGGIDYAATPRDWADCNYDPWVGEWQVVVWSRPAA